MTAHQGRGLTSCMCLTIADTAAGSRPPIRYGIADPAIPLESGVWLEIEVGIDSLSRASNHTNASTQAPTQISASARDFKGIQLFEPGLRNLEPAQPPKSPHLVFKFMHWEADQADNPIWIEVFGQPDRFSHARRALTRI
ncbi:hypothetical protein B0H13DRAFT_1879848 [Mycena leptocephala]|nr:hypothetical protein B0H13DRAFT_1879848 [Mycena leptocephala]